MKSHKKSPKSAALITLSIIIIIVLMILAGALYSKRMVKSAREIDSEKCWRCTEYETEHMNSNKAITETSETIGEFMAYYTPYEDTAWGETKMCDSMTIVSGDNLLTYSTDMVKQGNTVNKLNEQGELVMHFDLSHLLPYEKEMIKNSTSNNPVILTVQKYAVLGGKEAAVCHSFTKILSVREFVVPME
jgi:hypothetical protein